MLAPEVSEVDKALASPNGVPGLKREKLIQQLNWGMAKLSY